jgi:hypothetical protein
MYFLARTGVHSFIYACAAPQRVKPVVPDHSIASEVACDWANSRQATQRKKPSGRLTTYMGEGCMWSRVDFDFRCAFGGFISLVLHTIKAIFTLPFPTRGEPTVDNLVSSLLENARDRYKFTEAQEGYSYWNYIAIYQWENAGFLEPGSAKLAFTSLSYIYYIHPTGQDSK